MSDSVAKVLINLSLDRTFDYRIPAELEGRIAPGAKVSVPFGKGDSPRSAFVVSVSPSSHRKDLKPILSLCGDKPMIPPNLLKLGEWIASYYCCTREQAVRVLLPGAVRNGKIRTRTVPRCYLADPAAAAEYMGKATARTRARAEILKLLSVRGGQSPDALATAAGAGKSAVRALVKLGLIRVEEEKVLRDPLRGAKVQPTVPLDPTPDQAAALKKIREMADRTDGPGTLLLHGITCSGKTEVYLQAIAHILERGMDAIVLVPEISLTPQTVSRFRGRFGDKVSVLHSGLTDGERYDEWMKVYNGDVRIAVGARSALFAPFRRLGLIIVDEEHENSYKQSEAPRYNARDVAVMRGRMEKALVILGSATPSLESWHNAESGKYELASMRTRSNPEIHLPAVRIVNMQMEKNEEDKTPFFSKMLIQAVQKRLADGDQTILFLNKRGFARQMLCEVCGFVATCADCGVPYTYHRKTATLSCHLCGAALPAPETCPDCASPQIRYQGAGTERIEHQAHALFSSARIARMDSDTMTNPAQYEQVLTSFRRKEIDILIGTQMIAKGLDFPNVTLVGILNADMGLFLPDFRAQERTFQLLAQVAGRAGRGFAGGEVLIQTFNPFNPAIEHAANHDFIAFAEEELEVRRELEYPPFTRLCILHFEGPDAAEVQAAAEALTQRLAGEAPEVEISPPSPAPVERIKGKYRFMSVARGKNQSRFRPVLRAAVMNWRKTNKTVDFQADVDALNLL